MHCLPIGLENRRWPTGGNLTGYVDLIRELVVNEPPNFRSDPDRPLLLVGFGKHRIKPDRAHALQYFWSTNFSTIKGHHHEGWMRAAHQHRFTVCPWGHGLDTHRLWEVLLMGGIPVVRDSSIASCLDDSDNELQVQVPGGRTVTVRRGSVPAVVVKEWEHVTRELLEDYWAVYTSGKIKYDYSRLYFPHWQERIMGHRDPVLSKRP